jgi:hypothetical protein|nr:MAG TPA: protein of unknown function (DUF4393) [Caudoviricetes sp.]
MSDEKNSGNTFNINAVPSCIDEPVKAVLKPGANQIGTLFGDLLAMATSKIHFSAEKMRLQQAHDLEEFKKSLSDKLNAKPEECLVEPRMQVVGPAVENAKYCMDEPKIREMFQNLLANAADERYQSKVHPSFSAIIAQMSPLDAENLSLFRKKEVYPIARYKFNLSGGGEYVSFTHCFLVNSKMKTADELELQAASLSSLERQGLIEIIYGQLLLDKTVYEPFENTEIMQRSRITLSIYQAMENENTPDDMRHTSVTQQNGIVKLTPFGKEFTQVCFSS